MINRIKKILTSKHKGNGEFVTNALTVMVLFIMMLFFVDSYTDMKIKDNLDSVARKYILVLETTNTINGNAILVDIDKATGGTGSKEFKRWYNSPNVTVVVDSTEGRKTIAIDEHTTEIDSDYGDIITLSIDGSIYAQTGKWVSMLDRSGKVASNITISKSSTAKH